MEIAVSYTKKLNHALYGGNQYESSDFFCSLKLECEDGEDPAKLYADLQETVKEAVEGAVEQEIMEISGGLPKQEWDSWLTGVVHGKGWGTSEQYERMSPYQRNIAQMLKRAFKRKPKDNEKSK